MKKANAPSQLSKRARFATKPKRFSAVPRPLVQYSTGFPKQLKITHRFCETKTIDFVGPNVNAVYYSYGVNCLYDPVLALGGAQPLYFDQLGTIYNHYTVTASRIKLYIVPNRTESYIAGITIDDDATPSVTVGDRLIEQPSTVYSMSHRDVSTMRLYKSWDAKSVFGPNPLDNDKLQGNIAANPEEYQAFTCWFRPVNWTISQTTTFEFMVVIEFDTIWNELKAMSGS